MAVRLLHEGDSGIQIKSRMHDVAERVELGILEFSLRNDTFGTDLECEPPGGFRASTVEKLVLSEEGVNAESGIALKDAFGRELIIVAGAQPYGLAVRVPWNAPRIKVSPEYPLERYKRIAMH
jgi:hypothetical protein